MFQKLFDFADKNGLLLKWGSKGFSLNIEIEGSMIPLLFGYPPNSVFKQSLYTGNELIIKKIENGEEIVNMYVEKLDKLGYFTKVKSKYKVLKWTIDRSYSEKQIDLFLNVLDVIIPEIKKYGLKKEQ